MNYRFILESLRRSNRREGSYSVLIGAALVFVLLLGGGLYFFVNGGGEGDANAPLLATVERAEFVSQVIDDGEVQSAQNVDIRARVEDRVEVIEVVPEGTIVEPGDFLVQLDSTAFEDDYEQQELDVQAAESAVVSANATLEAARAARKEYSQGVFVENKRTIQNEIYNAKEERDQAQANLEHNRRLYAKGFINRTQLKAYEVAVQRAENSLALAEQKLYVLENITKEKELNTLDSEISAAEITYANEQERLKREEQRLREAEKQLEYCTINVPEGVSGEVVYHREDDRRSGSEWVLEPGAEVRERQVLIRLPNREKMEVKVLVNEQSINMIKPGMPATIKVETFNRRVFKGVVTKVNQYAEDEGWGSSSIREIATFVRFLDPPDNLIPGSNAMVTIQTQYEEDVMTAPIQCAYAVGDRHFALKKTASGLETVELEIGGDNTQVVWIQSGVEPGDQLVMNPGAYKDLLDIPEVKAEGRIDLPEGAESVLEEAASESEGAGNQPGSANQRGQRGNNNGGGNNGGRGAGRQGGGFDINVMIDRTMDQYDTNGDGALDSDELENVDQRMRDRLGEADQNGDGKISREELKGSLESMMQRMRQRSGGGRSGGGQGSTR